MNGSCTLLTQPAAWHSGASAFSNLILNLVHLVYINHQAPNVLSHIQTTNIHTDPIKDDLPVVMIDIGTTNLTKVRLEKHEQVLAKIVEKNDFLKEGWHLPL